MSQPHLDAYDYLTDINLDYEQDDFVRDGQRLSAAASLVFGMARSLHWRVADKVLDRLEAQYRQLPSPSGDDRDGFDFLGILRNEGSDNALYELTMDLLRNDIQTIAKSLPEIEQIALIYPLIDQDIEVDELVLHVHPDDWAKELRTLDGGRHWADLLRQRLMDERVQEIDRHAFGVDED